MTDEAPVIHEEEKSRFLIEDKDLSRNQAFLEYNVLDNILDLTHTFVPPAMRGRGLAGILVKTSLQYAVKRKLGVRLTCWFTADYVKKFGSLGAKIITK